MTYGIAKQNLKEWFDNDGIGEIDAVDFILALNALDKQIPKKPKKKEENQYSTFLWLPLLWGIFSVEN